MAIMSGLEHIWNKFLALVRTDAGSQVVDNWLKSVSLAELDEQDGKLVFEVPNQFINSWIKNNYIHFFKEKFKDILGKENLQFTFKVAASAEEDCSLAKDTKEIIPSFKVNGSIHKDVFGTNKSKFSINNKSSLQESKLKKNILNPKYVFENFIIGPNNYLAYSGASAVSKGFTKRYNPLFIYGRTGLGKTHLLHCIGNEYQRLFPSNKIIYKNAILFIEEFIGSVRSGKVQSFMDKYRKVDLLLIDDIQFLSQKEQTQEIFFNIFNRMYDEKKQIVLSSDIAPQYLLGFQERLISRFSWGLIADISIPSLETKIAILMKKAEDISVELNYETATFIAKHFGSNIREMEGALTRLSATTMLTLDPISIDLAKRELKIAEASNPTHITPDHVLSAVLKNSYGLSQEDLKSKKRSSEIVEARHIVVYLLKKYTNSSLKTIGNILGGRTHSTVLYSVSKVKNQKEMDPIFSSKMKSIENNLFSN